MSLKDFTDYKLSQNAYLSFDATTLKDLIISKLNENQVFTDQNYEGSNFSAFIDVVAYMYHVLLFYLNTTSNETTFTTATLYENMNKLVSNIGYKPTGDQTSTVTINLQSTAALPINIYTIPRYSFITTNGINYYTLKDIIFQKNTTEVENLVISSSILHQGTLKEATFTATGEDYETKILVDNLNTNTEIIQTVKDINAKFISDNTFSVYVKNGVSQEWIEWTETSSLFLEENTSYKYEKRINESGNYEFRFGNNNNGRKLNEGDTILIYYIVSDNNRGLIGSDLLSNSRFNLYGSALFTEISRILYDENSNVITPAQLATIGATNPYNSTPVQVAETVNEIRQNAPKIFSLQDRLVTASDYEKYIDRNFSSIVKPIKVISNEDYTSQYLGYFNRLGLTRPNDDGRVLINQVNFSTSTNFNNVYAFMVPKEQTIINEVLPNYLGTAQKQIIVEACQSKKDVTHNLVPSDPIVKAFSFGVGNVNTDTVDNIVNNSFLRVFFDRNVNISDNAIRNRVRSVIIDYFSKIEIGSVVDIANMTRDILGIEGINDIQTVSDNDISPKISFIIWNPDYQDIDREITTNNYQLNKFEYAYYYQQSLIGNKISIQRV
jgi:hypothetical protein